MKDIYIIGAGTYGEVMYELAIDNGYCVKGYYDDKESIKEVNGLQVLGTVDKALEADLNGKNFAVAIGNNKLRLELMNKITNRGGTTPTLIHSSANISNSASIGKGVYIQPGAVIWTGVKIDDYTIISPNVVVAHHTNIGKACLISTLSSIGAGIDIGNCVMCGMSTTVVTGVKTIAAETILGAGVVVIKDILLSGVYAGVPAKEIKHA